MHEKKLNGCDFSSSECLLHTWDSRILVELVKIFVKQFPIYFYSLLLRSEKKKKQWHQHTNSEVIIPNTHQNQIICNLELQGCLCARVLGSRPNRSELEGPANGRVAVRDFDSEIEHSWRDNAKPYLLLDQLQHEQRANPRFE